MNRIRLPQVKPYWYQGRFFEAVSSDVRNILITWPRRHGKDLSMLSACAMRAMQRVGNYYYLFPTRAWAERAIWNNVVEIGNRSGRLLDILIPPAIVEKKNIKDVRIHLKNGSIINFGGTDNLDFVGQGGYLYVLSEFSLHKPEVTDFIAPILREGSALLWMNGTLRGEENKLYKMMEKNRGNPEWYVEHLKPQDTKQYAWVSERDGICINPELLGKLSPYTGRPYDNIQDLVDSGVISFSYALQEFMNEPVSTSEQTYYGYECKKLREDGRLLTEAYRPSEPVYTFWDLGGPREDNDQTVIGFAQESNGHIYWIDYYERRGGEISDHLGVLASKPYRYGGHWMPHDAKRASSQTGLDIPSYIRKEFGVEFRTIPKTQFMQKDLEITRRAIARWFIDMDRCRRLLWCLENYHRNPKTLKPEHGPESHGADMARYCAMGFHLRMVEPYLIGRDKRKRRWRVMDDYIIG